MRGSSIASVFLLASFLAGCAGDGFAALNDGGLREVEKHPDTHYAAGGQVPPPSGFIEYCIRDEAACAKGGTNTPHKLTLTPQLWKVLSTINTETNRNMRPHNDDEHYGRSEYWIDPPDNEGDCEDYAIRKHNLLLQAGVPEYAIVYVVGFKNSEAHAVLWVITDHGELVLDNLTDVILPADETPYRWKEGQTRYRPWAWVSITQTTLTPPKLIKEMKEKPLTDHVPFVPHDCRKNNLEPIHCGGA